ncbi:MAG: TonB-dependent receptor [Desulfobacteraceae bacterium]|nr:TonB-dependent receptor [Desulfobacteraceae bacterium]
MNRRTLFAASFFCLSFFYMTSYTAAQEKTNIFTLGEIVVEDASGVQDIAISNTVTAEEIKSLGATNAAEALRHVPGVNVVLTTKGEMNVNIQGFQQKDILVLIDGVPYYETKNGPLDLQQIPASIIGKIEVIKGASSVLYGPNAMGGVINIITKQGVKGTTGSVSAEAGDGGYHRGVATLNHGAENGFSILGTVDYRKRDNLSFADDYKPEETTIKYRGPSDGRPNPRVVDEGGKKDNSDLESLNLWTRLGYAPTEKFEVYASLYHFDMERGRPLSDKHNQVFNFDDGYSSFGRYDEYTDMGADFGGRVALNDWWALRAMAFYHSHEDEYTSYVSENFQEKIATSSWDDDSYGLSLFSDTDLDRIGKLSVSVQYREDKHKQQDAVGYPWEDSESNTLTFAAEDTLTFGQFTTVLGMAYHHFDAEKIADLDGYADDSIDPMAGLTWTAENGVQLFGSIAKKTRFPTFNDMADNGQIYRLTPEENINYSLGAKYLFFDRAHVVLSGFYNDISDRIGEVNNEPTNIDKAKIYGIELETNTDITHRISVGFNYVYTHARNKSADRESDYLEDVPKDMLSASLGYMIPKIETRFIVRGTYKGGMIYTTNDEEKEYSTVVDLSLIKNWDNGFSLGGHIYNLLDKEYYDGKGMGCNGFDFKVVAQYEF